MDDYLDVSARPKLGLQFLISTVHVFYFTQGKVDFMGLFGMGELDPMWSKIFLSLMFVFLINAFYLIDGVNTLFGLFALLAFVFFAFFFEMIGDGDRYLMAMVVAGALLGFLWYNKTPAKVFMGDAGSLLLGYLLSVVSMLGVFNSTHTFSSAIPIIVLAIPILDTVFAIVRRLKRGQPV
ncbi:MAG: MraY family glycosyltransferase, partial [Bacteroidota bacterium]